VDDEMGLACVVALIFLGGYCAVEWFHLGHLSPQSLKLVNDAMDALAD